MPSLQEYLSFVKTNMYEATLIIMGNEAADLDSMASSIGYGYLRSLQDQQKTILPVMPIPRSDFILRTEAVYVFDQAQIDLDSVIFLDDVNLDRLMHNDAGLVLVDHNKLAPNFKKYSDSVVSIVDHHNDEQFFANASPRIIKTVGSTASLVVMEFDKSGVAIPKDLAILLAGTILLDTVNLDKKSKRVFNTDLVAAKKVIPLSNLPQSQYFNNIQSAKFCVDGLLSNDLLRKDYKEFMFTKARCGISFVPISIKHWLEIDNDLFTSFAVFSQSRNIDVLIAMNGFYNSTFQREMIIFTTNETNHDSLVKYLQKNSLDLTPINYNLKSLESNGAIRYFKQGNIEISRKKLQPLLASFWHSEPRKTED